MQHATLHCTCLAGPQILPNHCLLTPRCAQPPLYTLLHTTLLHNFNCCPSSPSAAPPPATHLHRHPQLNFAHICTQTHAHKHTHTQTDDTLVLTRAAPQCPGIAPHLPPQRIHHAPSCGCRWRQTAPGRPRAPSCEGSLRGSGSGAGGWVGGWQVRVRVREAARATTGLEAGSMPLQPCPGPTPPVHTAATPPLPHLAHQKV